MADHEHGKMDISSHEKTFAGFVKFTTYATVVIILGLIFIALVNG